MSSVDEIQQDLCDASREGEESEVESLLASLQEQGSGLPPHADALVLAGGNNHVGIAAALLAAGSSIDLVSPTIGFNALHFAVLANKGVMVRFLVERGALVDHPACRSYGEITPVVLAAAMGNHDVALYLVGQGAVLPAKAHDMACTLKVNLGNGKASLPLGLVLGDPACEYMYVGIILEGMDPSSPYVQPPLTEQQQKTRLQEMQAARAAFLLEAQRLKELAVKRADNMDRRIPFIWVLAENRFRPLADRLLEVPDADAEQHQQGEQQGEQQQKQQPALTQVFTDEGLVRFFAALL